MKSIKNKLLASFLTVIAVLVISEGFVIATSSILINKYRDLNDATVTEYNIIGASNDLVQAVYALMKADNGDKQALENFRNSRQTLIGLLDQTDRIAVDYNSRAAYKGLENNINELLTNAEISANDSQRGDYPEAVSRYKLAENQNKFVSDNTANLLIQQLENTKNIQKEIKKFEQDSNLIAFTIIGFSLLSCLWYVILFSRKIIGPLSKLTETAKKIENGDLEVAAGADILAGEDETASLAGSFNTMVASLHQSIDRLQASNQEIKKSRNNLKLEKDKLQKYLDVAGILVLTCDRQYRITLINKKGRELLGLKNGEIRGQNWVEKFVSPETLKKTEIFLEATAHGLMPAETLENIINSADGSKKNIVWHFSALADSSGNIQTILGTGIDITELTNAKITISQLKELDRFKNEVMNIATHELKTPLISIIGLSEVIAKNPQNLTPEQQQYITIINQEGNKLNNQIKAMLASARNKITQPEVNKEKINLSQLLTALQSPLNILAEKGQSKVVLDLQDKTTSIESDRNKISQVIYNFVDNAAKYGNRGTDITITLEKGGTDILVKVHNEGAGIDKEQQKKLFNKFSQLEPSLSRSQDGLGLGLYICKQNIDLLGGKIGVISAPGQGATFYFSLPITSPVIKK